MDRKALRIMALVAAVSCSLAAGALAQPFGAIDSPTDGQTVSGVVRVSGFVLDMNSIDKIEVLVDGAPVNTAEMYYPRVDVLLIFPTYANSPTAQPGFLSSFLAANYSNGPHTVAIRVTESDTQAQTIVASVGVVVDNTVNQPPFGYIDIPGAVGLAGANGSFVVSGWALDDGSVDHVDFLIDGQEVAGAVGSGQPSTATYGIPRTDVQAAFPDVPGSLNSGFLANIDTTSLVNGIHILSVWATDNLGASRDLGERTIQVINNGSNLAPFGQITFPLDKASLFCETIPSGNSGFPSPCTPQECGRNLTPNVVDGWSLDVGARLDQGQVGYVELLLDGQIVANSRTDCVQLGQSLENCYGINRPDVAQQYPGYPNADNAGFNFTFYLVRNPDFASGSIAIYLPTSDPSILVLAGFTTPGAHTLAIRAGDVEETVTQFGAMAADILCDQTSGDQPAFGYIDNPTNMEYISGADFPLYGWAYDFQGVSAVQIDVDGQVVGNALYGLYRPDVPVGDPRVPTAYAGFSFVLDTTKLSNTQHDLVVYVIDRQGNRSEIGRRKAIVNNNVPTHQ
ncbi:MAG TPA: Ig-like domain-containing protein [Thermoanaerobaculia bacterium]|nr:Ig-like domain-containing protein [Thermoanaerobaculia bacterium]